MRWSSEGLDMSAIAVSRLDQPGGGIALTRPCSGFDKCLRHSSIKWYDYSSGKVQVASRYCLNGRGGRRDE